MIPSVILHFSNSGIGYGLLFSPTMVMVNTYFDKRRSLASGLALAGGSMGTLLIPQLITYLVSKYAYRGALLMYAGLMMHMVLGTVLLRPTWHYTHSKAGIKKPSKKQVTKKLTFEKSSKEEIEPFEEKKNLQEADLADCDSGFIYDEKFQNELPTKRIRSNSIKSESDVRELKPQWSVEPRLSRGGNSIDRISNSSITKSAEISDVKKISGNFESGDILDYSLPFYTSGGSMFFMPYQQAKYSSNGSVSFMPNHTSTPYKPTTEKLNKAHGTGCCKNQCFSSCFSSKGDNSSASIFDWSLLKNLLFASYVIGICCGNCGYVNTFLFIPPLAKDLGLDKSTQALLLSIAGKPVLLMCVFEIE